MSVSAFPFKKARTTNATATSFTAKIPKATEPSGAGIFNLLDQANGLGGGFFVPKYLQLIPFGTDGNNDTFDMRLYGWNKLEGAAVWIPQLLIDVSVVLGDIAGTVIAADNFMADSLTVNDGAIDNGIWRSFIDCQEDMVGSVMVHTRGCQYIEFDFDLAGGQEAVSMNCLFRAME